MPCRITTGFALILVCALGTIASADEAPAKAETLGKIVRLDPRFDQLISEDAVIEKLAEGFAWSEGPVWDRRKQHLLFSDIPNNRVMKWSPREGLSTFLEPAGYTGEKPRGGEPGSNGLLIDAGGHLILCQHGDRQIARLLPDGKFETVVDNYEGRRLNSPNDAVFHSNGDLYFTDPPYGLLGLNDDPTKELDFNGVYRLSADGKLTLLTKEMTFPNGIALSPDEKTLYVANSDSKRAIWMGFDLQDDGTISNGRVLADVTAEVGKMKGLPDGLKVDVEGNLFATGPGGVWVFSADGTPLGRIDTEQATANCGWGDDGSTLYMTADMMLCRIKTKTKGLGF